jgi:hypothetical protein
VTLKRYPFAPDVGDDSPWGRIDHSTPLGPDCVVVSTPGHGGIWVSAHALARIPVHLRKDHQWFEEDCDWAIAYVLLDLGRHDDRDRTRDALACLDRWSPKALALHMERTGVR